MDEFNTIELRSNVTIFSQVSADLGIFESGQVPKLQQYGRNIDCSDVSEKDASVLGVNLLEIDTLFETNLNLFRCWFKSRKFQSFIQYS